MKVHQYPLLFRSHVTIIGNGFLADVDMRGKALLTMKGDAEEGESPCWIDGVKPGDLAAGGETLREAHAELQQTVFEILSDIAGECPTFDDFRTEVEAYFEAVDVEDAGKWDEALEAVRKGECGAEFLKLDRLPASDARSVKVTLIEPREMTADLNRVPPAPAVAA
jgi:hypothetical protein